MPLSLPNLDDLRWEDLVEEGRMLIPAWAPEWTNHNPSDPGITLVELFAYFSEKLMYQLNRVGDKNVTEFLKLINGQEWKSKGAHKLAEERRETVLALREPRRAVSAADFEMLTRAVPGVERAKCVAGLNLESPLPDASTTEATGHVSVVVAPKNRAHPSKELLTNVKRALEPARLLTTRIHVVGPRYVSVKCRFTIVPRRGVASMAVREAAIERLEEFFDVREGGPDGKGWPFGGNVYVSEIYRVLGEIGGIESVLSTRDASGAPFDELVVEEKEFGRVRRNSRGEVESVMLRPEELVEVRIEAGDISLPRHI